MKSSNYTAVVKQEDHWWIGWIEEVPGVDFQEANRGELLESLKITLRETLEFNRTDAIEVIGRTAGKVVKRGLMSCYARYTT